MVKYQSESGEILKKLLVFEEELNKKQFQAKNDQEKDLIFNI